MKVLVSKPKYFDVVYSINPWMDPTVKTDTSFALQQWEYMVETMQKEGVIVEEVEMPQANVPDFVFTANAGMVIGNKAIVSEFRDKERQPESDYFEAWFRENGYETLRLGAPAVWEGEACTFPIAGHLLCSYGIRADKESYEKIVDFFEVDPSKIVYAEIIDPYFYHLDVAFCPLDRDSAMYCEMAFSGSTVKWLKEHVKNLIPVSYDEALGFVCNALVAGKVIFVNQGISLDLKTTLVQAGWLVQEIPVSEFIKAGGGVKCMNLYLDRWSQSDIQ